MKKKEELFQTLNLGKEQRYTISVPFYAEHLHEVNEAMDAIHISKRARPRLHYSPCRVKGVRWR